MSYIYLMNDATNKATETKKPTICHCGALKSDPQEDHAALCGLSKADQERVSRTVPGGEWGHAALLRQRKAMGL